MIPPWASRTPGARPAGRAAAVGQPEQRRAVPLRRRRFPHPRPARPAQRDATTLPLIPAAIARGLPVLAICRGIQELNVALGGSLFQRCTPSRAASTIAARATITRRAMARASGHLVGGMARMVGQPDLVNSLHAQAVDQAAPGLVVEAVAADGTIEAVRRLRSLPRAWVFGVQWHPEWRYAEIRGQPGDIPRLWRGLPGLRGGPAQGGLSVIARKAESGEGVKSRNKQLARDGVTYQKPSRAGPHYSVSTLTIRKTCSSPSGRRSVTSSPGRNTRPCSVHSGSSCERALRSARRYRAAPARPGVASHQA